MADEIDWEGAVKRLIAMTKAKEISWRVGEFAIHRDQPIGSVYSTRYGGKILITYEYRSTVTGHLFLKERDFSEQKCAIEIVDDTGQLEFRWPATASRWDLLQEIRLQRSGAAALVEQLLAGAEKKG